MFRLKNLTTGKYLYHLREGVPVWTESVNAAGLFTAEGIQSIYRKLIEIDKYSQFGGPIAFMRG